jgi:hypothetical protein
MAMRFCAPELAAPDLLLLENNERGLSRQYQAQNREGVFLSLARKTSLTSLIVLPAMYTATVHFRASSQLASLISMDYEKRTHGSQHQSS